MQGDRLGNPAPSWESELDLPQSFSAASDEDVAASPFSPEASPAASSTSLVRPLLQGQPKRSALHTPGSQRVVVQHAHRSTRCAQVRCRCRGPAADTGGLSAAGLISPGAGRR